MLISTNKEISTFFGSYATIYLILCLNKKERKISSNINMELIKIENVTKKFANHTALDKISLSVPQGCIYGLLGPNGAGKTTLIRIINHITAPDSGNVYFDGHQLTANDVVNIGYLPEDRGLYKKMKVGDQALFFAQLKGMSKYDATIRLREWFERFGIEDWWNKKVEELSKGMAQKIQFIITVLHRPKLLIFDEPFSGFDPINANLLKSEILKLREEGSTIIFSTHNMSSVEELCNHITLINSSKNILSGEVEDIRRRFGKNRYELRFTGDAENLSKIISPYITTSKSTQIQDNDYNMLLSFKDDVTLKQIISLANENVELKSINPSMPSMDEIFIQTVESYNKIKQ